MRFNAQEAEIFDDRAGLSEATVKDIVNGIVDIVKPTPSTTLLEVGAGTGLIGSHLIGLPSKYIGFDYSEPMLEIFRSRTPSDAAEYTLTQGDGEKTWPVEDGTVDAVFGSRVLHLLDVEHVASELFRVAADTGATLMVGLVHRDNESPKNKMREKMRSLLAKREKTSRDWKRLNAELFEVCRKRGAEILKTRLVSEWRTVYNPNQSIESWENKEGLAGADVTEEVKKRVLEELREWANDYFDDMYETVDFSETYHLHSLKLPGSAA